MLTTHRPPPCRSLHRAACSDYHHFARSSWLATVEEGDIEALQYLQDISIAYSTSDPREYDITFAFDSAKNPYFSDATLTKSFTVPEAVKKDGGEFDLDAPTETKAVSISCVGSALSRYSCRGTVARAESSACARVIVPFDSS